MSDIKPWQIIVIVVAFAVLAFSGWRMMNSNKIAKGPDGYMTVDVLTGQLYLLKKGKAKGMLLPALNPETKDRTLYPVVQKEGDDQWKLDPGYAEFMPEKLQIEAKVGRGYAIEILEYDPIVHVFLK